MDLKNNMKILIAEDDFGSRMSTKIMLSRYGECDIVINGKEAVDAFNIALNSGEPYDLICLDIMMPEMSGSEALKLIREKEKAFNIAPKDEAKIVMLTALDMAKDVIEAYYKGGCTAYLVKPILKENIIKLLKDIKVIP